MHYLHLSTHTRVVRALEVISGLTLVGGLFVALAMLAVDTGDDSNIFLAVAIGISAVLQWALLRAVALGLDYLVTIKERLASITDRLAPNAAADPG